MGLDTTTPHLLIIDDDREIRELLTQFLERNHFRVTAAKDGREARKAWASGHYQLIVLDLMLPGEDGLDIARWVRSQNNIPIIMVTAMGDETDRIIGLEFGADDYVTKPFNPRELLARIRAVLRRSSDTTEKRLSVDVRKISFAGWNIDPIYRRLFNPQGSEIPLTGGEYDLLMALLERANRVLTREMLMELLHGRQAGPFDRSIDVAISRLRRKLDSESGNSQIIKTIRGGGYVLAAEVERTT
ncbi:response regulator [Swingsia samuiensis]|uniref:Regulatory protein VirG n=1 Tax=Swingsia samuiensis TaxID=1293412 RepID=A0A4Y6UJQ4_9PROT|nr:response regulator transcription factor [Swingsia samuiensis]QDH16597.1 response regulator transcription factor [Swingsia samuiensis]